MITRSLGKIIRGKATPLQLGLACILGSLLGFLPGYADGGVVLHSPGLLAMLLALLVVLNANLGVAALVGLGAKVAALALMPVSFEVGRVLLDGPANGPLVAAINAPVLAFFGLEYYAVTGSMVLGLAFGLAASVLVITLITTFRRRMATLEEGSALYQKFAGKGWVRALSWILLGKGKGKKSYAELLEKRAGNPVRIVGVVAVLLAAGLLYLGQLFFKDEIVTALLRKNLERANGATVDIGSAELDLTTGRLVVTRLAVADPEQLDTDLFRAGTLEAKVSTRDLLRKRIALDQVRSGDASTGEKRKVPGFLVNPRPKVVPAKEPGAGGEKTIDDYLKQAEVWKERLAQAKDWLDEIDRRRQAEGPGAEPGAGRETLKDRLRREVREMGYARVRAWHLIEKAPTLLIRAADFEGVKAPPLPGTPGTEPELLDIRARNLSTQPWLIAEAPQITVRSSGQTLDFAADLAGLAGGTGGGRSTILLAYRGLPADLIGEQLKVEGASPLRGGTMDISARGSLASGLIELPLEVTLKNTTMTLPGAGSAPIDQMILPIGVAGPLENPRILFDQKAFADALTKAGADQLAAKARGEVNKVVDKAAGEAAKKLGDKLPGDLKDKLPGISNLLGGGGGGEKKK